MAKREKLILPASFLAEIEALQTARGWHQKRLSVEADVSEASIIRMRRGEGSWDTVVKVARALGAAEPVLLAPNSPAARLERLRTRNPEAYEMVVRMLGGDGDGDGKGGGSPKGRGT